MHDKLCCSWRPVE